MGDISQVTKKASRAATIWGILVVILGVLAMGAPFVTGLAITISIGLILLATGAAQVVFAFQSDSFGSGVLRFVFGLLAGLCGISMILQPDAGLATITLFLAAWFFVDGIFALFTGFSWKPARGWGWMIFNGVLGIILGIMIYQRFPSSAVWLVGLLVGIRLLFAGWTMIALGSMGRSVSKAIEEV